MPKNNNELRVALLGALVALAAALPQHDKVTTSGQSADAAGSIDLPFLQFKNGGIRVNFAGYHAEAGLGGLLGGSDAKGGLFASAGTPWGPSASAGLGGSLGGQDGTARGGLHARAGLGNGRPEAAAGLGGALDGSARSGGRARGGLYAGATSGSGPEAAAGLGGSLDGSGGGGATGSNNGGGIFAGASDGRRTRIIAKEVSGSHVQSVPRPGGKDATTKIELKLPETTKAKQEVSSSLVNGDLGHPGPKYEVTGAIDAGGVVVGSNVDDIVDQYPSRRYYRKRYRNPARKHAFYKFFTTNTGPVAELPEASAHIEGGVVARKTYEDHVSPAAPGGTANVSYGVVTKAKSTTLFDDIFNIPISTLAAVNQLLNNKAG